MHLSPPHPVSLGCCLFLGGGSVVVDLLFYVPPIVCAGSVLVFVLVFITLCFAIILTRSKRELVALLYYLSDVLLL